MSPAAATSRSCKLGLARLFPAGGETDRAARAHRGKLCHHVEGGDAVHPDEGRIRRLGRSARLA